MRPTLLLIVIIALQQAAVCKVVNFKDQAVHSSVIQKGGSRAERAEQSITLESHFSLLYLYIQGQVTSTMKALIYSPVK